MKARDIMTKNVECMPPDASIYEAAEKMKSLDVGFIPLCENDRLVGTITDRDMVVRGIAEKRDLDSLKVGAIKTPDVVYVFEDIDIEDVAKKMQEEEVRRILVVDSNKRLVGVISLGDLSQARGQEKLAGETTRDITEAA